jgi:arylsulfatase
MVERMDIEIGRLVDHLREIGQLDNTLIMFMSDNGAEYLDSDFLRGGVSKYDNSLENIGRPGSYTFIGPGWGEAGSAPYYLSKGFVADGGTHVPAFVAAPALGLPSRREDAVIAAFDIAPTFLELAGADPNAHDGEPNTVPITGRSFAEVLRGEAGAGRGPDDSVTFEYSGQRAIRRGSWKALWLREPNGTGRWQLFDLTTDPGETIDVAAEHPDLLRDLAAEWDVYQAANGVIISAEGGGAAFASSSSAE